MQIRRARIDSATHRELKRLASELRLTAGEVVALAVRRLRQDRIGEEAAGRDKDRVALPLLRRTLEEQDR